MSTHLLIAAAYLEDLPQGTKLVLMAIADSADEHTLESAPGLPKLRAWSGLGKSQALAVVAQLDAARYVERLEGGRFGRRAVYRVFPDGVPAIPHPSEVAARYAPGSGRPDPTKIPNIGDDPVDNDTDRVRPTGPIGSDLTPSRVRPTGPLQSSTSVNSARAPRESTGSPVDKPTPSAPQGSGFPGARTRTEDRPDPRTQRGHHDQPCPLHPEHVVPCGRCAHAAATSDPAKVAQARQQARAATRAAKAPATKETRRP